MAQSLLMCSPNHYGVDYQINPWMKNQRGKVDLPKANQQWNQFFEALKGLTPVKLIPPQPQVPDLVFTANAGLVYENIFVPSRFRHNERRPEETFFKRWFQTQGYKILELDGTVCFEGAGDALFQPGGHILWAGHGFRTDPQAHLFLERVFKIRVISLRLIDPRFYHLDTCFCPLLHNQVMYYPEAFDVQSQDLIEQNTHPENRIVLSLEDALKFACNAVLVGKTIIMNEASHDLKNRLEKLGYSVGFHPVTEFLKSGGANKCLTLDLGNSSHQENRNSKETAQSVSAKRL